MCEQLLNIEFFQKLNQAYDSFCKPLCQEMKIPRTAFDILMFLSNHPRYDTARDIVEIRGIKANLVSINVDKLVQEGFLERQSVRGDRRKQLLVCTDKAQPIVQRGHALQADFWQTLVQNISEDELAAFTRTIQTIGANVDCIMEGQK